MDSEKSGYSHSVIKIPVFVQTPAVSGLESGLSRIDPEMFHVFPLLMKDGLFQVLWESRPCILLLSIIPPMSAEKTFHFLNDFKKFRMDHGMDFRDPSLRVIVVMQNSDHPQLNWGNVGVNELMMGAPPPHSLEIKLALHHQKAIAAPPKPRAQDSFKPTGSGNYFQHREWKVHRNPSVPEKTSDTAPHATSFTPLEKDTGKKSFAEQDSSESSFKTIRFPKQSERLSIEIRLNEVHPRSGNWTLQTDTQGSRWNWMPSADSSRSEWGALAYIGDEPKFNERKGTWELSGLKPRLLSIASPGAEPKKLLDSIEQKDGSVVLELRSELGSVAGLESDTTKKEAKTVNKKPHVSSLEHSSSTSASTIPSSNEFSNEKKSKKEMEESDALSEKISHETTFPDSSLTEPRYSKPEDPTYPLSSPNSESAPSHSKAPPAPSIHSSIAPSVNHSSFEKNRTEETPANTDRLSTEKSAGKRKTDEENNSSSGSTTSDNPSESLSSSLSSFFEKKSALAEVPRGDSGSTIETSDPSDAFSKESESLFRTSSKNESNSSILDPREQKANEPETLSEPSFKKSAPTPSEVDAVEKIGIRADPHSWSVIYDEHDVPLHPEQEDESSAEKSLKTPLSVSDAKKEIQNESDKEVDWMGRILRLIRSILKR